jgi:alpha-glucosidase
MRSPLTNVLTALSLICGLCVQAQKLSLYSPDRKIQVAVRSGAKLTYAVRYGREAVLLDSPLGFEFLNSAPMDGQFSILDSLRNTHQQNWEPVVKNKHQIINDHYNELHLILQEKHYPQRKLDLFFRAYNDGIAFRYGFHTREGQYYAVIMKELTGYRFAKEATAWVTDYGSYTSPQEKEFLPRNLSQIQEKTIAGLPFLTRVSEHCFAAITEANITDWPGFYIGGSENARDPFLLHTKLSPLPGEPEEGMKVKLKAEHLSPWRVVMIAPNPGKLIESDLILNLNEPCAIPDVSWIKAGQCAWDHWWSGDIQMDTKTIKQYIQFAADMHFPYMLIDAQWYGTYNKPDANVTQVNPAVDMHEVLRFAQERQVKCWLWVYHSDLDRKYEEAFSLYEKWGIAGVKIDFMNRDDQDMVVWYHKIIKAAAAHHLMVNFHSAYKPDGYQRTYPNLMTREAVLGNEYSKWSLRITPEHNVTIPFTRMLAGPMDYTPGGFLNRNAETFKNGLPANVMSTRCQQLAMFVVYESPVTTVCDAPEHYAGQPGLDFLKAVPTTWDDTRFLSGYPGDYICLAKRSGNRWFIAAMNNGIPREIEVPLDFLPKGNYLQTSFADAPDAGQNAEHLAQSTSPARSGTKLRIKMVAGGGYAAYISPVL